MEAGNRLLSAAKRMDKEALTEIFDLYARYLYNYVLRYCNDPILADQIVGDAFANFLEQLAIGKGPLNNLRSYLFEIAFHLIIDETRYVSRRDSIEQVDIYRYGKFSINPDIENKQELEEVSRAIQTLSPDQRHVIILRFLEGFSIGETAMILRKTISCVKVTQFRAIGNLRIALGRDTPISSSSSDLEMTFDT